MTNITVCVPVHRKKPLVKGSIKGKCVYCKREIWISPATQQSIKTGLYPKKTVCTDCVANDIGDDDDD